MKKVISSIVLAAFFVCSSQISKSSVLVANKIAKNTPIEDEREVSGFSGIMSSGSFDVFITLGNKESLRLEGDQDMLSEIETIVEKGILKIRTKDHTKMWNWKKGKVTVYITAKALNTLTMSGSGDMKVEGIIKADHLTTTVSGSGSISFSADSREYVGVISGSGEINAKGSTDNAKVTIAGSGNFEGKEFHSVNADIKVSGSGDASIYADKTLDAAISGSGNISYSGNAQVSKTKSGSGTVSKF